MLITLIMLVMSDTVANKRWDTMVRVARAHFLRYVVIVIMNFTYLSLVEIYALPDALPRHHAVDLPMEAGLMLCSIKTVKEKSNRSLSTSYTKCIGSN